MYFLFFWIIKAKPTENGLSCKIPFLDKGQDAYHCTALNECLTESGKAKCTLGIQFI